MEQNIITLVEMLENCSKQISAELVETTMIGLFGLIVGLGVGNAGDRANLRVEENNNITVPERVALARYAPLIGLTIGLVGAILNNIH